MKIANICTAVLFGLTQAAHQARQESPTTSATTTSTTSSNSASATPTVRNHNVAVGQNGTTFTPTSLKNIPIGDSITFYFYPSNYSLVQSSFDAPCTVLRASDRKALFPGFHAAADPSTIAAQKFIMHVTDTSPMWLYAVNGDDFKASHGEALCQKGMVMVINALPKEQAGGQTLGVYRKNAAGVSGGEACPPAVNGGDVVPVSDRERARWMAKHPIGGNVKNVTADGVSNSTVDDGADYTVAPYVNEGMTRLVSTTLLVLGSAVVFAVQL